VEVRQVLQLRGRVALRCRRRRGGLRGLLRLRLVVPGRLPAGDARRLVAAEIMGAIYRAILDKIEQREFDVFSEVVRIPRPRRALIAAATWGRTMLRP